MVARSVCCVLVFIALMLSGCTEGPGGGSDPESGENGGPGPGNSTDERRASILDHKECKGTYGSSEEPVRCENELDEITLQEGSQPGPPWLCVGFLQHEEGVGLELYWNPSESQHGIRFWSPETDLPVSGIIGIRSGEDENISYSMWNDGMASAFFVLPVPFDEGKLALWAFTNTHESNMTEFESGSWRAHWTLYGGAPYPVRVLDTGNDEYYFPAGGKTNDAFFPYTFPLGGTLSGNDGWITIESKEQIELLFESSMDLLECDEGP